MTITAQSADGMLHQFPDGTPDAVIDRAMADYVKAQTSDTAADSAARGLPPNPAAEPVAHTGYRAQVNRTMSGNGPQSRPAVPSMADLGHQWADVAGGAAVGIPAGLLGIPGDIEGLARFLPSKVSSISADTFLPTSSDVGNWFAGAPSGPEAAGGRIIGNLLGPGALLKTIEGVKLLTGGAKVLDPLAAQKAQAASDARSANFVIPPTMASDSPSLTSRVLSAVAGKTKTAQAASAKNAEQVAAGAAEDLGLPKDQPITEAALEGVRSDAGKIYTAAKSAPVQIITDDKFKADIGNLDQIGAEARAEAPELVSNPELETLVKSLSTKEQFSPAAAIDLARVLRARAQSNLKNYLDTNKRDLGRAQSRAANALETLVERNLEAATTARGPIGAQGGDMTALVDSLRNARQTIAKSYDVENALNPVTGHVDANKLATLRAKGKPLTGGIGQAAETATAFPKAFQNPARFGGNEGSSVIDAMIGLHGIQTGNPKAMLESLAWLTGRPALRKFILSDFYQNRAIPRVVATAGAPGTGGVAPASAARMFNPKLLALVGPQVTAQLLLSAQNQAP